MKKAIKAAVIGGSGYTGLELIKVLNAHRFVHIELITSNTYKGRFLDDAFPLFSVQYSSKSRKDSSGNNAISNNLVFFATDEISGADLKNIDIVFLCLPPLKSMGFVKENMQDYPGIIIDIGSDFRLKNPEEFKFWYKKDHIIKGLLNSFVYGLPELNSIKIKKSRYIANPGCYPTSVLLALAPLFIEKTFSRAAGSESKPRKNIPGYLKIIGMEDLGITDINIDAKSGVSGAGRKLKDEYLFCSVNENFFAYAPLMHRHIGEIEQELGLICGNAVKVCFTPHLLPVNRGIFTAIYCKLKNKNPEKNTPIYSNLKDSQYNDEGSIKERILGLYEKFYSDCHFVRFIGEKVPKLGDVIGTNYCNVGFAFDPRTQTLKLFSAIDNLLKGAAGQAVQNMNIIFNFDIQEGLDG